MTVKSLHHQDQNKGLILHEISKLTCHPLFYEANFM